MALGLTGCWLLISTEVEPDAAIPPPYDARPNTVVIPDDVDRSCVPGGGGQPGSPWPMAGGGPEHHGRSALIGPAEPEVRWIKELDGWNYCTDFAVGADGSLYLSVYTYDQPDPGYILALAPTGETLWRRLGRNDPHRSGVAIGRDGTLYASLWSEHALVALGPGGEQSWEKKWIWFPDTVTIAGDGLILVASSWYVPSVVCPACGVLWALSPDGDVLFQVESDYPTYNPAVGPDCTIYLTSGRHLVALDPGGRELWRVDTQWSLNGDGPNLGPDGTIYVSGYHDGNSALVAVSPEGEVRWELPYRGSPRYGHAIGLDGTIFFGNYHDGDGELMAVTDEGQPKWTLPISGYASTPPTIDASGVLYWGTSGDGLYAIEPDGTVAWHFDPGDTELMRPAITFDRTLVVGSIVAGWTGEQGRVYALGPIP